MRGYADEEDPADFDRRGRSRTSAAWYAKNGASIVTAAMANRPDYGVDAPGVVRGLALAGIAALALAGIAAAWLGIPWLAIVLAVIGFALLLASALTLRNALAGKFRHRDRILGHVDWRGDERVLDVGTGRGLLLVGAVKRLTTGRGAGLDIWSKKDLSDNSIERTMNNLAAEGVAARCELVTGPAQEMPFPDGSFDVVVSNLCLHNIRGSETRAAACREIARVLGPGGIAVISDLMFVNRHVETFREVGMTVEIDGPYLWDAFPPQKIAIARKPQSVSTATAAGVTR
jgi:arsenite methyltransferase